MTAKLFLEFTANRQAQNENEPLENILLQRNTPHSTLGQIMCHVLSFKVSNIFKEYKKNKKNH